MYIYVHIHTLCSFYISWHTIMTILHLIILIVTESQQLYIKYHLWNKINHQQVRKEHNRESAIYITFEWYHHKCCTNAYIWTPCAIKLSFKKNHLLSVSICASKNILLLQMNFLFLLQHIHCKFNSTQLRKN